MELSIQCIHIYFIHLICLFKSLIWEFISTVVLNSGLMYSADWTHRLDLQTGLIGVGVMIVNHRHNTKSFMS